MLQTEYSLVNIIIKISWYIKILLLIYQKLCYLYEPHSKRYNGIKNLIFIYNLLTILKIPLDCLNIKMCDKTILRKK